MLKIFTVLFVLLSLRPACSQNICGTVSSSGTLELLAMARVDFVFGNDTIYTTYTDSTGKFEYCDIPKAGTLSVKIAKRRFLSRKEVFEIDSQISVYEINFTLFKALQEHFCPQAGFEINRYKEIVNLDIENIKYTFEEYPTLCIKTVTTLYPGESEKLVDKRNRTLQKTLLKNGIDISRIYFSSEFVYMTPKQTESIQQNFMGCPVLPNISFLVQSMEGDCW